MLQEILSQKSSYLFRSCKKNLAVTEADRTVLSFFLRNGESGGQEESTAGADSMEEDISVAEASDGAITTAEENSDTEMEGHSDTEASDTDEDEMFWVPNTNT